MSRDYNSPFLYNTAQGACIELLIGYPHKIHFVATSLPDADPHHFIMGGICTLPFSYIVLCLHIFKHILFD